MDEYSAISELPNTPVVYALYAGNGPTPYVVYVGYTTTLKTRIVQHLVARDSSINTASAAARLNPERITEVRWWKSDVFMRNGKAQPLQLKAAELIAFRILKPVLRSNVNPDRKAQHLSEQDEFKRTMEELFDPRKGEPHGRLHRRENTNFILAEIDELRKRIEKLEGPATNT